MSFVHGLFDGKAFVRVDGGTHAKETTVGRRVGVGADGVGELAVFADGTIEARTAPLTEDAGQDIEGWHVGVGNARNGPGEVHLAQLCFKLDVGVSAAELRRFGSEQGRGVWRSGVVLEVASDLLLDFGRVDVADDDK